MCPCRTCPTSCPNTASSSSGSRASSSRSVTITYRAHGTTPTTAVGLARWRRRDDVEAFWASGHATPLPGGNLESIEVLEELEHMTLEDLTGTGMPAASSQQPAEKRSDAASYVA